MKTVFKSSEIAHIWAHSAAPFGRSPGNLSFDGEAIRSYATVIGRRIRYKGKVAYVLDRASFSNNTSKSQGWVCSAIPETEKVFCVRLGQRNQDMRMTPAVLSMHYLVRAKELEAKLPSRYARIRAQEYQAVTELIRSALDVAEFFGLGTANLRARLAKREAGEATAAETLRIKREQALAAKAKREAAAAKETAARNLAAAKKFLADPKTLKNVYDLAAHEKAVAGLPEDVRSCFVSAIEKRNAEIETALAAERAEKVADWIAGGSVEPGASWPVYLRAEAGDGGPEMVTSNGARVPLEDAERTYRFACLMRAKGWHKNGERHAIGSYQLDAVNEQGVVAGCHRVTWQEIERFAAAQGWKGGVQ